MKCYWQHLFSTSSGSLQGDLSRWLIGITLLGSLLAGSISGILAYLEIRYLQDDLLRQIAHLLPAEAADSPFRKAPASDDDAEILVEVLSADPSPVLGLSTADPVGRAMTVNTRRGQWRVYIRTVSDAEYSTSYAIAQQTELRDEFASASAITAVTPVLLLALLLLLAMHFALRQRLKPVSLLARQLDQRRENQLNTINTQGIPAEILPFIEAINRLLQRVATGMQRQKQFIADAAHELRTPVTALSLLAEQTPSAATPAQSVLLNQGLARLQRLVEQLLNLARLQADYPTQPKPVAVEQLISELVADLYPLAEAKQQDLGIEQLDAVVIDDQENALRHIVQNAIGNAIHYTPEHGRIDISLVVTAQQLCFSVEDSGPGIPAADLDKVTTPFYRDQNHTAPGHGLGLAIATEAAKKLGGSIELHNRTAGGLRFCFIKPLTTA